MTVAKFRLDFVDDGSTLIVEADDFDDDGDEISLYVYVPPGGDPVDPSTRKEVVAAFSRSSLAGPPQAVE